MGFFTNTDMKIEELKCYDNKKIKILLVNKFIYTCVIEQFFEDSILVRDKFGNSVLIVLSEIAMISELGGRSE